MQAERADGDGGKVFRRSAGEALGVFGPEGDVDTGIEGNDDLLRAPVVTRGQGRGPAFNAAFVAALYTGSVSAMGKKPLASFHLRKAGILFAQDASVAFCS